MVAVRGATSKRQMYELEEKIENLDRAEVAALDAAQKLQKALGSAIRT